MLFKYGIQINNQVSQVNIQTEDMGNITRFTKNMMISIHGMLKHPAEVVDEGEGDGGDVVRSGS